MKYRRGCVWRVLQANGVFGEKVATDSVHNILINNKGKKLSMFLPMFIYAVHRVEGYKCRGGSCCGTLQ